ncbi:hypothetical protein ACIRQY_28060 [Streptomyces sp. NPDC101490]|uniref:hypothetical protein n=1 Tax=Streptomyces sp. NPDC101490 TaxID=3366143 RepID=UPI00381F3804
MTAPSTATGQTPAAPAPLLAAPRRRRRTPAPPPAREPGPGAGPDTRPGPGTPGDGPDAGTGPGAGTDPGAGAGPGPGAGAGPGPGAGAGPADQAGDVVRWAVFCCALVPVVLLVYGSSLAGAAGTACGLVSVTTACRLLLRRAERGLRGEGAHGSRRG